MKNIFVSLVTFIAFATGISMTSVMAKDFHDASIEKTSYTTSTSAMAARGQRFYVGD